MKHLTKISLVLRLVIAVIFIQTLYFKFTAHPDSVYIFTELGIEPFGRIGLGIVELITSILLFIPRTKILAILSSLGIIIGAIVSHLIVIGTDIKGDGGGLFTLALVVFALSIILMILHKTEVLNLVKQVSKGFRSTPALLVLVLSSFLSSCAQETTTLLSENKMTTDTISSSDSLINLTNAQWKERLTPEQYYVLRQKGTEQPYSGEFVFNHDKGTYKCAGCGEILFTDDMKFDSHCGWPSFDREVAGGKIIQTEDHSHGMHRTEITCARCGGHLGHIFDDGPTETGERYCVNSASLTFEPANTAMAASKEETITLAGGCFWCIEAVFEEIKGVLRVESGYSGGTAASPTYRDVCSGETGHAEVVQVVYNPSEVTLTQILEVFFTVHDPTTLNRQGADIGTQYRSAIFYHNEIQKSEVLKVIAALESEKVFSSKIVTEVTAFGTFYKAENYHQEYYELHKEEPYCRAVIQPKMEKLHKLFANNLKHSQL
ncbi:MAG: hypothetical protein RL204_765 [Bacteroidota bacterium]|jgi:peptide methionine sulfoxide reductase msrA/msrB